MTGPAPLVLRTASAEQTRCLAGSIAPLCVPGDVLLLAGDLGAGKTTFAQGFGAGLGVTEAITSPTFTLVRQYTVDRQPADRSGRTEPGSNGRSGVRTLLHADVYRLDRLQEIVDLGLGELVEDGGVAVVEWGDAAAPVLGEGALAVDLVTADDADDHRVVWVRSTGTTWSSRWGALQAGLAPWLTGP
jgi:tRNA threonylcarbamoyladenosine biosynthesis protein TsaE